MPGRDSDSDSPGRGWGHQHHGGLPDGQNPSHLEGYADDSGRAAEPGQRQRQQILRTADGTAEAGFSPRQAPLPDLSNEQIFPAGMQARVLFDPDMKWRLTEEFGPHSFETRADGRLIFDYKSKLLQLAKGWSNFIFYRTIIWWFFPDLVVLIKIFI